MLRNVTEIARKTIFERENKPCSPFFVTKLQIISVVISLLKLRSAYSPLIRLHYPLRNFSVENSNKVVENVGKDWGILGEWIGKIGSKK